MNESSLKAIFEFLISLFSLLFEALGGEILGFDIGDLGIGDFG